MESSSNPSFSADSGPSTPILQSSVASDLRFPAPPTETDPRISTWVEDLSGNMAPPSEDGSTLGDSAYEFIDTDNESRDDNATESIASTDLGRPEDDVASLVDTERSTEESGDEDEQISEGAPIPAFPGLDLENFDTPTIGRNSAVLLEEYDKRLAQSIEFEEPFTLGAENVSVKHTVAEFKEEDAAKIVEALKLPIPPQRLAVSIRQTMAKQCLSTRDALRILYVGSHSAKQDIIHKLASSVTASVEGNQHLRHSGSQLYNVVPVSAFGTERIPEIELMHSSGFQIKVEDCSYATSLKFEDEPQKPDVIKLILDDNVAYHSVPDGAGYIVEPHWELPHIAIFYCTDSDSAGVKQTSALTRKFMGRHNVPSIVISHKQLFDRAQAMALDQHSIHMCLESRDPHGRGPSIHHRFPIDLASFLNIDARQMNRNLAYLTGLHEITKEEVPVISPPQKVESTPKMSTDVEKTSYSLSDSVNFIRNRNGAEWRALLPVGLLLVSVFTAVLTGIPGYQLSTKSAISINSKIMSTIPISSTSTATLSSLAPSITSTTTVSTTRTRTITVTRAEPSAPNSLSVVPSMELGKPSQPVQSQSKNGNKSVCSAEVLGDREILIRIPSATKLSWLTKEAFSVNITRGNDAVDTERAYSSDEGIVLLLPKKQAYGVLNVSIITTKKPRVNETFQLDFGTFTSQAWQSIIEKMSSYLPEELNMFDPFSFEDLRITFDERLQEAQALSQENLKLAQEAKKLFTERASSATESITEMAKRMSLEAAKRSAIISKEIGIRMAEVEARLGEHMENLNSLREPFSLSDGILKAQVKSKLMWLKMQGKEEEYKEYEKAALEATRKDAKEKRTWKEKRSEAREKRKAKKANDRADETTSKKSAKARARKASRNSA